MAAPPRVAAWLRAAPDGPARVLHACADAVHLEVAGRCVSLVGPHGPGLPVALRSKVPVMSSSRPATAYLEGGILRWGGRALVTGRLVDVRAPRIDAARVPKASPAVARGSPRSRAVGLVAFAPVVSATSVSALVGRGDGLTPLGDDVICGWLAAHRAAGVPTDDVDAAVRRLLPRTTTLSASLLGCAVAGEVADPVAAYLRSLGTPDEERARSALEAFGQSSGLGLAHGLDLALGALTSGPSGMSTDHVELRAGAYADSVTLLQVSRQVQQLPGVVTAQVAMATPLNVEVLERMGFTIPGDATVNHLVVAVRLDDADGLEGVRAEVDRALTDSRREASGPSAEAAPRTTGAALLRDPGAVVLVSVPGPSAAVEAVDALEAGSDVMVFSDHVPVEQEVALKSYAAERGLLVMGPDCGTAVVDGVGLGFANVVAPGPVGIVAASGTGCQQVLALLDHAGVGVAAAYGVGGRDLSAAVGGLSTRTALSPARRRP